MSDKLQMPGEEGLGSAFYCNSVDEPGFVWVRIEGSGGPGANSDFLPPATLEVLGEITFPVESICITGDTTYDLHFKVGANDFQPGQRYKAKVSYQNASGSPATKIFRWPSAIGDCDAGHDPCST